MPSHLTARRISGFLRDSRQSYRRWEFRRRQRISPRDTMFNAGHPEHYFAVGESALDCIRTCLEAAGRSPADVRRVLDFGCGHGRVLRRLTAAFPDAAFTVSDQDASGVDFCARTFGARAIYSTIDPHAVALEGPYDLIWVGSVFTHLNAEAWHSWLTVLAGALAPEGVLVLTTQGPIAADYVRAGAIDYGVTAAGDRSLLEQLDRDGFGFVEYPPTARNDVPPSGSYGVTLITPELARDWLGVAGLEPVAYLPAGWDGHQDAYGITRTASHLTKV